MGEVLKKLVIQLGIDSKDLNKGIADSQKQLQGLASSVKKLIGGYLSYQALSGAIRSYQDFNLQIANTQALIGGSTGQLAAMARAMKRFGGDTQSVMGALKSMNSHLQAAKFGGGALIDITRKYGISISAYSSADKALLSLAKQMQGFSRQTKVAIMSQMGLDEAMQRAFIDGGVELERYLAKQRAIGVETDEDIKLSQRFNNAILDMKDMFSALTRELSRALVPIIEKFVNFAYKFIEALRKNKAMVVAFFAGLAILLAPVLLMFIKMAIASAAAFAPFYAIAAIVAFVILLIEDLYYYFMGWNSATGELVKKFPVLAKIIAPLKPLILGIVNLVQKIVAFFKDPSWTSFGAIFQSLEDTIGGVLGSIKGIFTGFFDYLAEKFPALAPLFEGMKAGLQAVWDLVSGLWGAVKNFFKALFEWNFDGMIKALQDAINVILDLIKKPFNAIKDAASGVVDSVKGFFGFGEDETPAQAPAVPVSAGNTRNVNIQNNLSQNITTNATQGQITSAGVNALTQSVSAQSRYLGGMNE